jgi:hypothetical protein
LILWIYCVDADRACDPWSNLDFVHFIWNTKFYFLTNHATVILPSRTTRDRIIYVRHHMAEMGGGASRACAGCAASSDPRCFYNVGCIVVHSPCSCTACHRTPPSLKSTASRIIFDVLFNISKFVFSNLCTYDEYAYVSRHIESVGVPIERLVPFGVFPKEFKFRYFQFDE